MNMGCLFMQIFLIFLNNVLQFSVYKPCSLVKSFLKCFFFPFGTIVNGIVFLVFRLSIFSCKTFRDLYSPKGEEITLHSVFSLYLAYIHIIIPTAIYQKAQICVMCISLTCGQRPCSVHLFWPKDLLRGSRTIGTQSMFMENIKEERIATTESFK